jgi:hypothetical protein
MHLDDSSVGSSITAQVGSSLKYLSGDLKLKKMKIWISKWNTRNNANKNLSF